MSMSSYVNGHRPKKLLKLLKLLHTVYLLTRTLAELSSSQGQKLKPQNKNLVLVTGPVGVVRVTNYIERLVIVCSFVRCLLFFCLRTKMALNKFMHPRNIYKNPPDFGKLAISNEEFSSVAKAVIFVIVFRIRSKCIFIKVLIHKKCLQKYPLIIIRITNQYIVRQQPQELQGLSSSRLFLKSTLKFCFFYLQDVTGKITIDFKDAKSLRILTKCLLKCDFDLDVDIPGDRLVPTLPLRLNYILWIEDLLNSIEKVDNVWGLDIGRSLKYIV